MNALKTMYKFIEAKNAALEKLYIEHDPEVVWPYTEEVTKLVLHAMANLDEGIPSDMDICPWCVLYKVMFGFFPTRVGRVPFTGPCEGCHYAALYGNCFDDSRYDMILDSLDVMSIVEYLQRHDRYEALISIITNYAGC